MTFKNPRVKIKRFRNGYNSVLGKLYIDDEFFCFTLEREWLNNEKFISCIPTGKYNCKPYSSTKYPNVTEVTNVTNRDKILIHQGNYYSDIEGCILLGDRFDESEATISLEAKLRQAVYNSKKTLKIFFDKVGREFQLEITDNINLNSVVSKMETATLATKTKNKMALPLLALIPILTKLGIKGASKVFDKLKGRALDKAKDKIFSKIFDKTGINLADNPSSKDVEIAVNNLPPEQLLELKKEIIESETELKKAELENQTEQMAIVNRTMRAEMRSESWIVRLWRPLNGIFFGISMFFLVVGSVLLNAYAIFTSNAEISTMVSVVNQSLMAALSLWAVVVGGHTIGRSFEKYQKLKKL